MSLVAIGFSTSWFLSITSSSFRESELVQKGGKLRSMKIEPPKCRPKALSPEAAAITQTFQRKDVPMLRLVKPALKYLTCEHRMFETAPRPPPET